MSQDATGQQPNPQEFSREKTQYFSNFALTHMPEMRRLVEGRVLGKGLEGAQGWRNVAEHNLLAGVVADKIGQLVGLPEEDRREVTSVAATHDWDKRLEKERHKVTETKAQNGMVLVSADVDKIVQQENSKTGLVRVTGGDWRDIETWGLKEKVLRYVDSGLDQTPDGHADFIDWRTRLGNLAKRHPQLNIEGGKIYGDGVLLYTKLGEITEGIQNDLYHIIIAKHPKLQQKYPKPAMLTQLIRDQIKQDIENMPSKIPRTS